MIHFLDRQKFYFPLRYWLPWFWIFYSSALTIFLFAFRHHHHEGSWYNFLLATGTLSLFAIGAFMLLHTAVTRHISSSIEQVYGHPVAAFQQNLNLWQEIIHPADLDLVLEAYQQLHTTGSKQIEYRIIQPDGAIRWLSQRSILVSDAGRPRRFDGMVTDITTYKQEQALHAERAQLDALRADIGALLLQSDALPAILQQCAEAVVTYLDAAFVRIWTFDPESQLLVLQASAGLYTHLDGSHSRIPLGQFVIGQIAQQRLPHITADLLTLPSIRERSWAHREGIVAFAGYPLIVEGEVVGVIAAFARQPFSQVGLDTLAFVAGSLAQLIERKQTDAALRASEERFRLAIEGARHGVWDWNVTTGELVVNQQWAAMLGYELQEITPHIEVHHRVKNNLQIISSLLNLQGAQIKDSAVLQIFIETKNRVRSMALLHETLYSTENLARIDFARYVGSLCAHLFRSYGVDTQRVRLQTAIAGVSLDLDQAIPCGLIINELVSNAVKYAFPDHQAGTIWVALQPHTNQQYQLCVRDNGVGLPVDLDLTRTDSLGLRLVHDLTLQLNGTLTSTRAEGATFTILFEQ